MWTGSIMSVGWGSYMYHDWLINPFKCFFSIKGHVALDRTLRPGYPTLAIDPRSSFKCMSPYIDSSTHLTAFYTVRLLPYRMCAKQGGSLYHLYDVLWYDPAGTQTCTFLESSCQWATENPLGGSVIAYIPSHKSLSVHLHLYCCETVDTHCSNMIKS